jgi:hypothetical protein
MATTKLGHTGSSSRLISYCEKKAVEKDGIDCDPEYAKSQFRATQELHGKGEGVQAYHVIQSFKPGEIEPGQANAIGKELAQKLSNGHEAVVYTHSDKDHIHNHIVINAVHPDTGKKFQLHGKEAIDRVRDLSDGICHERGYSVVQEHTSKVRKTLAEYGIEARGETSWKGELRQAIDYEKKMSKSYGEFKKNLSDNYGIEVNERGKNITFKHPDHEKAVRGNKLGHDYERGTIENGFSRQIESERTRSLVDGAREQLRDSGVGNGDRGAIKDDSSLEIGDTSSILEKLNSTIRDAKDAVSLDDSERNDRLAQEQSVKREQDRAREQKAIERSSRGFEIGD